MWVDRKGLRPGPALWKMRNIVLGAKEVDSIATVDFSDCFNSQESEKLWQIFGEIPIDNADAILEEFLGFPEGTDRIEIWHWFDENYPEGVAALMNGGRHGN